MVRLSVAYLLLAIGGIIGWHLAYVGRHKQALLVRRTVAWVSVFVFLTLFCRCPRPPPSIVHPGITHLVQYMHTGAFCGVGLLHDALTLPRYVAEANGDAPSSTSASRSVIRAVAGFSVALLWASVASMAADDPLSPSPPVMALMAVAAGAGAGLVGRVGTRSASVAVSVFAAGAAMAAWVARHGQLGGSAHAPVATWAAIGAAVGMWATSTAPVDAPAPASRRSGARRCGLFSGALAAQLVLFVVAAVLVLSHGKISCRGENDVKLRDCVSSLSSSEWHAMWRLATNRDTWRQALAGSNWLRSDRAAHLETLGLDATASDADVKAAYRRLARQHHPDKSGHDTSDQFRRIQEAYEYLKTHDDEEDGRERVTVGKNTWQRASGRRRSRHHGEL